MDIATQFLSEKDFRRASGERLRLLIDALGIRYVDAAADMGITKSHLGNIMEGAALNPYLLYKLCRRRGVTMDWVFLGDPSGLRSATAQALLQPLSSQEGPEAEKPQGLENSEAASSLIDPPRKRSINPTRAKRPV